MPSTITWGKGRATALTLQTIANGAVVVGPALTAATKGGATLKVRMSRLSTTSMSASLPEFRLEGQSGGHGAADSGWFTIMAWTPSNGATAPTKITVNSTPGANSLTLDAAAWTGITASDGLVFIQNNTITLSEFNRILSVTTSVATFQRTMTGIHTLTTSFVFDQAEEWSIPISFEGEESVRLVVDSAKNVGPLGGFAAEGYYVFTQQMDAT